MSAKTYFIGVGVMAALGIGLVASLTILPEKGKGIPNADFTITESSKEKLKTAGFGYQYEFRDKNGNLMYQIIPDNKKKVGEFKDAYLVLDPAGKLVNAVIGKAMKLGYDVYNPEGKQELSFARDYDSKAAIEKVDTYRIRTAGNKELMTIRQIRTWGHFNRQFDIESPTGQNIGQICSKYTKGEFWTQNNIYDVKLNDKNPETVKNVATAIRWIDGVEDKQSVD